MISNFYAVSATRPVSAGCGPVAGSAERDEDLLTAATVPNLSRTGMNRQIVKPMQQRPAADAGLAVIRTRSQPRMRAQVLVFLKQAGCRRRAPRAFLAVLSERGVSAEFAKSASWAGAGSQR